MKFFSTLLLGLTFYSTLYCPEDPQEAKQREYEAQWGPPTNNASRLGKLERELDAEMAALADQPPPLPPAPRVSYATHDLVYIPALPLPEDEEPAWEYVKPRYPNPDATLALIQAFDADDVLTALKRGADIDGSITPPLIQAVRYGKLAVAQALLEYGADPNVREGSGGETALHFCVRAKNAEMANLLCEYGADPEKPNMFGTTATRSARNYRQYAIIRVFKHWYPSEEALAWRKLVKETQELIKQAHTENEHSESRYAIY